MMFVNCNLNGSVSRGLINELYKNLPGGCEKHEKYYAGWQVFGDLKCTL